MDYAQEQADEIEALESIYTGYIDKLSEAPPYKVRAAGRMSVPDRTRPPRVVHGALCVYEVVMAMTRVGCGQVRVAVDPEAAAERKGDSAEPVRLEITFPDTYPDVAPTIVVKYSHILPKHAQARTRACLWQSVCA